MTSESSSESTNEHRTKPSTANPTNQVLAKTGDADPRFLQGVGASLLAALAGAWGILARKK
ncbi:LPXTG cell wall anchor domain-containing protein [Listeria seeligeri]|uniref:LPXTG cell wall anchor domain-containing protein n=1 Tax=Listeria seeligeri TaxID=1640 RepID=UPI00162A1F4D|nr:LPXTG cell wall anchor domain-containing protein [Listeria seeligeri]MBC1481481.1 LPXTG cell wall anchor domain-containing protein [Listeria seeligeri]MBC1720473.1 LPXTG cell wall anchor domain-containing protein [Listeria seeligeri]